MKVLFWIAWVLAGFGAYITAVNFYLSFLRYPLHRLLHRDQPYRWISGIPLIASGLLWLVAIYFGLTHHKRIAMLLVVLSLFDTGGLHWFALSMWRFEAEERRKRRSGKG